MKNRLIAIFLISLLLASALPFAASEDAPSSEPKTRQASTDFTHAVLAEDLTAQWCVWCPSASEALNSIYESGDYPFYFICFVDDMNEIAATRTQEDYNIAGYPTVEFDGGFSEDSGGGEGKEDEYRPLIEEAGARTDVADVDITLNGYDEGDATLNITALITNNEGGDYDATLKIFITEIVSRWDDYDGNKYPFAFLDYAYDGDISVPAGESFFVHAEWDGSENTNKTGSSFDYGDIDPDNIMLIAALFDTFPHPKHHSSSPNIYTANYVDETVGAQISSEKVKPTVEITYPSSGDQLSGTINITAEAQGKEAIKVVEYQIDHGDWQTMSDEGNGKYSASWDTTQVEDGDYTLTIRATDFLDMEDSKSIDIEVDQGVEPPPPPPPPDDDDDDDDDDGTVPPPPAGEEISIGDVLPTTSSGTSTPTSVDVIYVNAKVTGDNIDTVSLVYTTVSGELKTKMRVKENNMYEGSMGPFSANTVVSYHVSVEDRLGKIHNGETLTISVA